MSSHKAYTLMNKDTKLVDFYITGEDSLEECAITETYAQLPVWISDISTWIENRSAAKHRQHVQELLDQCGGRTLSGFIGLTHCLSLNDTLWVKSEEETVAWRDVSLYTNDFNEVISKLSFDGNGLCGIMMSTTSPELTTDGSFDKCWIKDTDTIRLIKAGSSGARNAGMEPYCEVLASAVYEELCGGIHYKLDRHHGRVVSSCNLFTSEQYGYKPAALYGLVGKSLTDLMSEYAKVGSEDIFRAMILADCVTVNSDRHFGNFGFLVDNDTFERVSINPVFDYNLALFPYADWCEGFTDMDAWISKRGPAVGRNYYLNAKTVMSTELRAKLINLKDLSLSVAPDDKFIKDRVEIVNSFKNTQIDRILGNHKQFDFTSLDSERKEMRSFAELIGVTYEDLCRMIVGVMPTLLSSRYMTIEDAARSYWEKYKELNNIE